MIYGIGVDLVKVARIERVLGRYGDRFCARVFTEREIAYCRGKSWAAAGFAMRFAAKEAFSKALGVGLRKGGIRWREVEVIPNPLGKPEIFVSGRAAPTLRRGRHRRHPPLPHRRRRPRPGRGDFGAVRGCLAAALLLLSCATAWGEGDSLLCREGGVTPAA